MEVKIEWSELSTKQLNYIFDYYSIKASPSIAKNIVNKIVDRVEILLKNPVSGPKEELLSEMSEDFRYLVESNYKIIYWQENETITIASVFDCRQNPEKMKII
ncbi:type II toxin-antitoxin system RelE/ParE family toxin [Perlabentimonas gracilis]|uniref:type II toxin-antitoxin system RelE/ParE family toxin n=1 Tax=Perlabentimonas gracilis TaxID=2715279 RepID=UPI00140CA082|nr:type II toxin-antitoxin system RelE/ParE family toxin [Perlabentimonas gracilis]NHB68940.1 type II toxin-antitoxin system RelE/ParE family toxin [Perlabentimonas gracilis]